jgi:arylsulfatase A-like enzyme
LAEVEHLDGEIALLDVLKARGLAENTLVVFMGDNGTAMPHGSAPIPVFACCSWSAGRAS